MKIVAVTTRRERRNFIKLPYALYRDDAYWVAPLRSEQKKMFDPKRNSMLAHCRFALFIAYEDTRTVGRIAAFVDETYNEHWNEQAGFFGSYECVDRTEVSRALLSAAKSWLTEEGMAAMRGPINFESQNWGFIIEGFDRPPVLMSPYNPPYYNEQMEQFGLSVPP